MIDNLIWNFPKSGRTTLSSSDNNNIDTFADDRMEEEALTEMLLLTCFE